MTIDRRSHGNSRQSYSSECCIILGSSSFVLIQVPCSSHIPEKKEKKKKSNVLNKLNMLRNKPQVWHHFHIFNKNFYELAVTVCKEHNKTYIILYIKIDLKCSLTLPKGKQNFDHLSISCCIIYWSKIFCLLYTCNTLTSLHRWWHLHPAKIEDSALYVIIKRLIAFERLL